MGGHDTLDGGVRKGGMVQHVGNHTFGFHVRSQAADSHIFGLLARAGVPSEYPVVRQLCSDTRRPGGPTTQVSTEKVPRLHYTTVHYTTLHYTTLHYITPHYTTLHYAILHYNTLHYTTLHFTTLH